MKPASTSVLRDMLLLVDRPASIGQLMRWTPNQRASAEKWAAAVHLRASDNIVRVPPEPSCVKLLGRKR